MSFTLLEKVLTSGNAEPLVSASRKVSQVFVQVKRGNSNSMEWGIGSFAATKGIEMLAPAAGVSLATFSLPQKQGQGNTVELNNVYIRGTSGEGVNFIIEEW